MADTQQQGNEPKKKPPQTPKGAKDGGAPKSDAPKVKKPRERSDYVARLKTHFEQDIREQLTKQFSYTNRMQVPKITKVVLNMGIGEGVADRKKVDNAANDLSLIAGQKAVITKSRKSIATYKLRDGQAIGCKVRLHRPAGEHRAAAHTRLPRPQSEEFRRPRQLQPWHQRIHRVPGDRFRQGDRYLGPRHHRLHKRAQ
jgi:large subunit ribosomal protein L5